MDDKLYAVIDTNVVVSAMISKNPASSPLAVLAHVFSGAITPVFNEEIISEYRDVLSRGKFHLNPLDVEEALRVIIDYGLTLDRTKSDEVFPDPKDIVFYEVALSKKGSYLVTGNTKHFPKTPILVTPAEMLEILKQRETRAHGASAED